MTKHLVDIDDDTLAAARIELRTSTINDTVNEALRLATGERAERVERALATLRTATLDDREQAWR